MGLPRSNLVKPKPASAATPAVGGPFTVVSVPFPIVSPTTATEPFAISGSSLAPAQLPPLAARPGDVTTAIPLSAIDALRPTADTIEVDVDPFGSRPPMASLAEAGPSKQALLERAAILGPARMTWESFSLPNDPVLAEKIQPHVAARRARLTRVVKVTLGVCGGLCALALAVTGLSGGGDASSSTDLAATGAKTVPSKGLVTIERLDGARRMKATGDRAHLVRRAAAVTAKHR